MENQNFETNKSRIYTDTEELTVDLTNVDELIAAMDFKSEHIKAKAEPRLFEAVANALRSK